jgi:hypothetical protein
MGEFDVETMLRNLTLDVRDLRKEVAAIPEKAAEAARREARTALLKVGLDTTNATEHQRDMALVSEIRDMAEQGKFFEPLRAATDWKIAQDVVKRAGLKAATASLVAAAIGLFWLGFSDKLRSMFHL